MQYDVKSVHLTATGVAYGARTRLKTVYYTVKTVPANAADIVDMTFFDNAAAASGTQVLRLSNSVIGQNIVDVPGEGIICDNGISINIGTAESVTLFFG
tara:strand:+ start:14 stop:310 length:297 start_codon:yes stop_codon:yes gene_type:complete